MKHWSTPTRLQYISFYASMPIIDFLLNYILYDERIFKDISVWLFSFPLLFFIGMASWRGHTVIGNYIKKRYPELNQTRKRILLQVFCLVPFMSFSVTLIFFLYDAIGMLSYKFSMEDFKLGLLVGFCVNLIFETLYEADYALEKYKESVEEKQRLQQMSAFQEFDTLKNQVNPHFLFNCFNTLSSLITEDKNQAKSF